ncbi:MAG: periplasmic heavy metal sensor [Thermodesulfobacteriota bacterium]|nr:periplasmic heavy metal sensor [Thermodesulfobacteriota bacterium]
MKQLTSILGVILLIAAVAVPVMAWGPGHHMMGYGGWDRGYNSGYAPALTAEQQDRLKTLNRQYYDETQELRTQLRVKNTALDAALSRTKPDISEVKAIQKDISRLRASLDKKSVEYEVEVGKIVPDNGRGRFGFNHMGPYHRGHGYAGHGYCWNQ